MWFIRFALFPFVILFGLGISYIALSFDGLAQWMALGVVISTMLIVLLAEHILPYRKAWQTGFRGAKGDLSSLAIIVALMDPLHKQMTLWLGTLLLMVGTEFTVLGWFPSHWPLVLQLLLFTVLAEFGRYWIHRLSHTHPLLWRFHAVHHAPQSMHQLNGYRIHPVNYWWNFVLGQLPLILAGASEQLVLLYFVLSSIVAAFQHANIDSRNGILNFIFSTNEVHRWHHTRDSSVGYKNHGTVIMLWDWVFGSYFLKRSDQELQVGLINYHRYPKHGFLRQLIVPFCWTQCVVEKD